MVALGIGLSIALILAEVILRIYNPFQSRIRGGEIVFPAHIKYEFKDVQIPGLDKHVVHQKNSIGFRGPELDAAGNRTRIFCVGGSTTECFYLSDGSDWPSVFMKNMQAKGQPVWVNNAGLDGHSTFGHIILLKNHLLQYKPKVVLFLVGCNDVAADGLNAYEQFHLNNKKRLLENLELFNTYLSWKRSRQAAVMGVGHQFIDVRTWAKADTSYWQQTEMVTTGYTQRLDTLIKLCLDAGATPVFITQPTLLAPATDSSTGRYLGDLAFQGKSALHYWAKLNAYNNVLRGLAARYPGKLAVIDAAAALKPSTDNFYDFFHYTKQGAQRMAEIVVANWPYNIITP